MTGTMPRNAMVLAAGLGKRMAPLTDRLPKPLVPVRGRTLIDRVLDRLAAAEIDSVIVNLHHHADQLETHLAGRARPRPRFIREATLLETGGGVANALPLLGPAPFFVANADVLWLDGTTPALARLAAAWDEARMDALLLMQASVTAHGHDGAGDYFLDPFGVLRRRREREIAPFIYAGVQILHPRLFAGVAVEPFSLNRLYDRAEAAGRLFGIRHDGAWFHIGTMAALAEAEAELAGGSGGLWAPVPDEQ